MLEDAAERMHLLGRSGRSSGSSLLHGPSVRGETSMMRCDVAASEELNSLSFRSGGRGYGMLMHAGGVLADATIAKQSANSSRRVFSPNGLGSALLKSPGACTLDWEA